MNRSCKLFVAFLSIVLMIGVCAYRMHYAVAQTGQPESKLEAANKAVEQAFKAVLDAEQAGANVTGLLARLNVAGDLLAQAEIAVRKGDSGAGVKANSAFSIAAEVEAAAVAAKETVVVASRNALWITFAFSVEGAIIFALALFLVWLRYKKSYIKDLFEAKPEVNGQ